MIFVTDLDHTLAQSGWRDNLRGDWDAYHAAAKDDKPIADNIILLNSLHHAGCRIVCLTTRPERWRVLTTEWLLHNNVMVDNLIMRPNDDFRKSPELKSWLIEPLMFEDDHIIAIDDREDVVTAYRALGITAYQVFAKC